MVMRHIFQSDGDAADFQTTVAYLMTDPGNDFCGMLLFFLQSDGDAAYFHSHGDAADSMHFQ